MEDKNLYTPSTEAGRELRINLTDIDRLRVKAKLMATATSIYDKTILAELPPERKESNFELATLLLDSKKLIDHYEAVDMKRQSRNFELINRCLKLEKEKETLQKENDFLKKRIPQ